MKYRASRQIGRTVSCVALAAGLALSPAPVFAQDSDALLTRIEQMEAELGELRARLEQAEARAAQPPQVVGPAPQTAEYRGAVPGFERPFTSDISVHIAGYADAGFAVSDAASGTDAAFTSGTFNPSLHMQYRDLLMFESEAEIAIGQDGATDFELEYSQLNFLVHDNATFVVGKFLSPVGQFQERLHPSWINRLADAPAGFGHGGVQPTADVGVQLRGGIPLGGTRFTYVAALGNGPRLNGAGEVMTEGFGGDDNENKAISGRLGFLPFPFLEVGASLLRSRVNGPSGAPVADEHGAAVPLSVAEGGELGDLSAYTTDYNLWGVDAAYTRGPWDVRFEYLRGTRDAISAPDHDGMIEEVLPRLRMTAWYGQLAYRLSGLTDHPILGNFEPVVRYGEYRVDGLEELADEAAEERWDFGLNYWFAPTVVLHGAVQRRSFTDRHPGEDDRDTRLLFKLGFGF